MNAIVAVYSDWGIGCCGTQPIVIPEDRAHFRNVTGSGTVIVGRKTLADFPGGRPLKNRRNIVITTQNIKIEDAEIARSPENAAEIADNDAFVIGGGSVYHAMLGYCHRVYVTKIEAAPESDTFFPNLDKLPDWVCTDQGEAREHDGITYRFMVYERRQV